MPERFGARGSLRPVKAVDLVYDHCTLETLNAKDWSIETKYIADRYAGEARGTRPKLLHYSSFVDFEISLYSRYVFRTD